MKLNQKGVTLLELVLSLVIIGVVVVVSTEVFVYSSKNIVSANRTREAVQMGRMALDRMGREIRNIGGNRCVTVASRTQFSFVDVDRNSITFSWNGEGSPLRRNNDVLVDQVNNLSFTYYNRAYPPVPIETPAVCSATPCSSACVATEIWLINMDLTTQSATETMRFRSQVHPLNF